MEKHGLAVLSVAAGNGIASIMHQLGAAEIISGGQSMNPPVEAFIKVIEKGSAEQYIIFDRTIKTIILAAEQVKKFIGSSAGRLCADNKSGAGSGGTAAF